MLAANPSEFLGINNNGNQRSVKIKALDIGTGSGYIAACLAEFLGRESQVVMIDHIKDILDFATNNIRKAHPYLLK